MQEGEEVLDSLSEDLDEDVFRVLLSPTQSSGESEDDTTDQSSVVSAGHSSSSVVSEEPSNEDGRSATDSATSTIPEPSLEGANCEDDADDCRFDNVGDGDSEDFDATSGGGDRRILPSGPTAQVCGPPLATRASVRPALAPQSANPASPRRRQPTGSGAGLG